MSNTFAHFRLARFRSSFVPHVLFFFLRQFTPHVILNSRMAGAPAPTSMIYWTFGAPVGHCNMCCKVNSATFRAPTVGICLTCMVWVCSRPAVLTLRQTDPAGQTTFLRSRVRHHDRPPAPPIPSCRGLPPGTLPVVACKKRLVTGWVMKKAGMLFHIKCFLESVLQWVPPAAGWTVWLEVEANRYFHNSLPAVCVYF